MASVSCSSKPRHHQEGTAAESADLIVEVPLGAGDWKVKSLGVKEEAAAVTAGCAHPLVAGGQ